MSARSSMRQSFNEWMASQGYNDMDDVFLEAKIEEYVRAALSQAERETARLRARNRALEAALGKYDAAYRRVMEQAGKLDSDVWYAVTKAQAFAAALTEPTPPAAADCSCPPNWCFAAEASPQGTCPRSGSTPPQEEPR